MPPHEVSRRRVLQTLPLAALLAPAARALGGLISMAGGRLAVEPPVGSSSFTWEFPSQADEEALYDDVLGWTWAAADKANNFSSSYQGPSGTGIDQHDYSEADDLWNHYVAYRRTGSANHLTWAQGWRNYFVNSFETDLVASCGSGFNLDHVYGWGLVLYAHHQGDAAALAAAESIGNRIAALPPPSAGSTAMAFFEARTMARRLLLATYLAEETGAAQWITLRDQYLDAWLQSPDYETTGVMGGMYFASRNQSMYVSGVGGTAAYDAGRRFHSAFQIGILFEALWRAYLSTGRADVRARLEEMAWWMYYYAHDPTWVNPMVGARYGQEGSGARWHQNGDSGNANTKGADPAYDTASINALVMGYKLTGYRPMLNRAHVMLRNGTIYSEGHPSESATDTKLVGDNDVHHYLDTISSSADSNILFAYNKGETQYAYLVAENGGDPDVIPSEIACAIKTAVDSVGPGEYAQVAGVQGLNLLVDSAAGGVGHILPYADKLVYDPITRNLIFANSDDPGAGRRIVAYNLDTNTWTLIAGTVDSTQRGVAHIYGASAIDVKGRRFHYGSAGTPSGGTAYRNLDNLSSETSTGVVGSGSDEPASMEQFPDHDAVYYVRNLNTYRRRTHESSWTQVFTNSLSLHSVAHYNGRHKCLVYGGGNYSATTLYRINRDGTRTTLGAANIAIENPRSEMVEEPTTGDFLVYRRSGGTSSFRRFNPATDTWTNPGTTGIPAVLFSTDGNENALLMVAGIIPEYRCNVFLAAGTGETPQMWVRRAD